MEVLYIFTKRIVSYFFGMEIVDQTGCCIKLASKPVRVISLVPSQSEFLWDIGIQHGRLIGITKFCIHPNELYRSVARVGGTKNCDIKKIKELSPDLIIGNKEENNREQIIELKKHYPVWLSDVNNLQDALLMMEILGQLAGMKKNADQIIEKVKALHTSFIKHKSDFLKSIRVAYLIWKNPLMVVGRNTFIDAMIAECGFINVFSDLERYPVVTIDDINNLRPDFVFLSSEPFHFSERDEMEIQNSLFQSQVLKVNGECFSWYGSRLLSSFTYFELLINKIKSLSQKR